MISKRRQNRTKTVFSLLALVVALAGCSNGAPAEPAPGASAESNKQAVAVSRIVPLGESRPLGTLDDPEDAKAFGEAFRQADRFKGIPDIGPADYEIDIETGGEPKRFHLWLGSSGAPGLLMDTSDSNKAYTLEASVATDLRLRIASIRYEPEKHGDVIQGVVETTNLEAWHTFMEQVAQARPASVQIAAYTVEGDPIFHNLDYDGRVIHYLFDNFQDGYGLAERKVETCDRVVSDRRVEKHWDWTGTVYGLDGCDERGGGRSDRFQLRVEDESRL